MKTKFIKIRTTDEERNRWQIALSESDRTLSDVCRATLDRLAKRHERKTQEQAE